MQVARCFVIMITIIIRLHACISFMLFHVNIVAILIVVSE